MFSKFRVSNVQTLGARCDLSLYFESMIFAEQSVNISNNNPGEFQDQQVNGSITMEPQSWAKS